MKFNPIPDNFKIKHIVNHNSYLINGELKHWDGPSSKVYSTISSTDDNSPTLLGSIPLLEKDQAIEALDAASAAYDNGKG
jgi:glyceraldehyde-3-phosphate dehydrogenase (NADP+)